MTATEHPERAFIRRIVERGERYVAVPTNLLAQALEMTIRELTEGRVVTAFQAGKIFTQGNGVVQGGILATMLDFGMVFAVFSTVDVGVTIATVSQTTNFLRAASAGAFAVEASVDKSGRNVAFARAALLDEAGRMAATATASFAVVPR